MADKKTVTPEEKLMLKTCRWFGAKALLLKKCVNIESSRLYHVASGAALDAFTEGWLHAFEETGRGVTLKIRTFACEHVVNNRPLNSCY